jgi:hypothetical protein
VKLRGLAIIRQNELEGFLADINVSSGGSVKSSVKIRDFFSL